MPKLFSFSRHQSDSTSNQSVQIPIAASQKRTSRSDSETAALSITPTPQNPHSLVCPSFEEEPWRSRAAALRPTAIDEFFLDAWTLPAITPPPLPPGHPYVKLLLEYLDSIPDECWIDEENDVD